MQQSVETGGGPHDPAGGGDAQQTAGEQQDRRNEKLRRFLSGGKTSRDGHSGRKSVCGRYVGERSRQTLNHTEVKNPPRRREKDPAA